MRQKIVAGNWKMNKNAEETEDLLNDLIDKIPLPHLLSIWRRQ
jgi:triosephosphate isomerase (TIM)